ncbi:hypothetical protein ACHHYP_20673 [Achlya hypogyna]|uniref:Uncharacterized protein n=1 Tax=Achlya hypogyna TaxID=1202772 RepID=A0A1V9YFB7_ACHHY|nr:hypothetical protein ACHHYP_20673 [Achlya hypogyna]
MTSEQETRKWELFETMTDTELATFRSSLPAHSIRRTNTGLRCTIAHQEMPPHTMTRRYVDCRSTLCNANLEAPPCKVQYAFNTCNTTGIVNVWRQGEHIYNHDEHQGRPPQLMTPLAYQAVIDMVQQDPQRPPADIMRAIEDRRHHTEWAK